MLAGKEMPYPSRGERYRIGVWDSGRVDDGSMSHAGGARGSREGVGMFPVSLRHPPRHEQVLPLFPFSNFGAKNFCRIF